MRRVFQNPELQAEFEEKGYVIIPFMTAAEVKEYYDFYMNKKVKNDLEADGDRTSEHAEFSVLHSVKGLREMVFKKITNTLIPRLNEHLDNYKPLIAHYILKKANGKGIVPLHQNWSLTDEDNFASISLWCPLIDTNLDNGTLQLVPGSHKMFRGPRGNWGSSNFKDANDIILEKYLEPVFLKAGQAVIFDDSILHYSTPNISKDVRLAVQMVVIPNDAKGIYYYKDPHAKDDLIEAVEVEAPYFWDFKDWVGNKANCKPLGRFNIAVPQYDAKRFESVYLGKPIEKPSVLQRVVSFFK